MFRTLKVFIPLFFTFLRSPKQHREIIIETMAELTDTINAETALHEELETTRSIDRQIEIYQELGELDGTIERLFERLYNLRKLEDHAF